MLLYNRLDPNVEDVDGNITRITRIERIERIERSGAMPTAIIAPDGQRTALTLDVNGYLDSVTPLCQASCRL